MWPLSQQKPKPKKRGVSTAPWERPVTRRGRPGGRAASVPEPESRASRALGLLLAAPIALALLYGVVTNATTDESAQRFDRLVDGVAVKAGLGVDRVMISGREHASLRELRGALGFDVGTPLFRIDCEALRQRLLGIDWVAEAEVRRVLPDRIDVSIVERVPIAIWQHEGVLRLIDATGHPIVAVSADALARYPHVVGAGAPQYAAALFAELGRFPEVESRVTAAIRVGERRWSLELDNGTRVDLPAENMDVALSDLMRLEKEQKVLERGVKTIDLRFKDKWILRMPSGAVDIRPPGSRDT